MNYSFGCEPDIVDPRDYRLKAGLDPVFREEIDLSHDLGFEEIRDQGSLGACTSFATTDMVRYVRYKTKLSYWEPSQLFTYYATRKLRNTINEDSGATAREALKSTVDYGVTKDNFWPYDITKFAEEPPKQAWDDALTHQSLAYFRLDQTLNDLIGCLSDGYPFTFGMKLYQSFIDYQKATFFNVIIPIPDRKKEKYLGGHCMLAVGYYKRNDEYIIIVRNSWGIGFGTRGYVHIPLSLMLDPEVTFDFWTLRTSESDEVPKPETIKPTLPVEPVLPPEPEEPIVPLWKNKNFYFLVGFGVLAALFLLLK
jgi:C1A family cysteine protease